jgi:hypothetical protein
MEASRIRRLCRHIVACSAASVAVVALIRVVGANEPAPAPRSHAAPPSAQERADYAAAYRLARAAFDDARR